MKFSALRRAAAFAAPVLLLSLREVAQAADAVLEDGVMVLTGDTIEQAIKDHSHLVVEFYAPCEFPPPPGLPPTMCFAHKQCNERCVSFLPHPGITGYYCSSRLALLCGVGAVLCLFRPMTFHIHLHATLPGACRQCAR